jgi:hypothetical protein
MQKIASTESWLLPLAGVTLFLGCVGFFIAWLATGNPWCLVGAFVCFKMITAQ